MKENTMYVKDLEPGMRFTYNGRSTVYTATGFPRVEGGLASVSYTIDGNYPAVFTTRPLSTVVRVF